MSHNNTNTWGRRIRVNEYAREISKGLDGDGIDHFVTLDEDGDNVITVPIISKKVPGIILKIYAEDQGKCTLMTNLCFLRDSEKRDMLLDELNECNGRFSFVSFSLGNRGQVVVTNSFLYNSLNPYEIVTKYINSMCSVIEEVIEDILLIAWDKEKEETLLEEYDDDFGDDYGWDEFENFEENCEPNFEEEESLIFDDLVEEQEEDDFDEAEELFSEVQKKRRK